MLIILKNLAEGFVEQDHGRNVLPEGGCGEEQLPVCASVRLRVLQLDTLEALSD
jgi:hypothetical protein